MRRLLLVEDDPSILDFLPIGLSYEGYDVTTARSGHGALAELATSGPFDIVVLDLGLPGIDGRDVLSSIRRTSDLPVLILSARGDVGDRVAGLQAGADDYLPKPFRLEELLARLDAVLRRRGPDPPVRIRAGDVVVDRSARTVHRDGALIEVTTLEFDLLELLISNCDKVLTRDVIADRLWGIDVGDSNTLEVHISKLRRKLERRGPRAITTVRGVGYVFRSATT